VKAEQWFNKGQLIKINNKEVFVYDSKSDKPVLVILHGYPTCSYDYYKVLTILEEHFRVIIHDHIGFGYSDKPKDYSYSLIEQADIALLLWNILGVQKAHILAHDYGTSVATEIIARDNLFGLNDLNIKSITLCNGSMHVELAQLRMIQKLLLNKLTGPIMAKLTNKNVLAKNLKNIYYDPTKLDDKEIEALWRMMIYKDGKKVIHQTTQYIKQRYTYWHRWIGALQQTELAINILWAKNDKVAIEKMAYVIHQETKNSKLKILDNLGHFPMLEDAERWAGSVIEMMD
jgi:pimeloyl-ACP methyl ester carboxylesterase